MKLLKHSTHLDTVLSDKVIAHRNELSRDGKKWQEITLMESRGRAMVRIYQYDYYEDDEYSIADLKVEPSYRGSGLGRIMLSAAEKIIKMIGGHSITLFVNEKSWMVQWYERRGYTRLLPNAGTLDGDIWMTKTTSPTQRRREAIIHAFLKLDNPIPFIKEMSEYDDRLCFSENIVNFVNKMSADDRLEELWEKIKDKL